MCEDVAASPGITSLVGPIVGGVVRGAQRARQKPHILRRILLVIRALLVNPHLHLGPQNYVSTFIYLTNRVRYQLFLPHEKLLILYIFQVKKI